MAKKKLKRKVKAKTKKAPGKSSKKLAEKRRAYYVSDLIGMKVLVDLKNMNSFTQMECIDGFVTIGTISALTEKNEVLVDPPVQEANPDQQTLPGMIMDMLGAEDDFYNDEDFDDEDDFEDEVYSGSKRDPEGEWGEEDLDSDELAGGKSGDDN